LKRFLIIKFTKFSLIGIVNSVVGYFLYLFLLEFIPYMFSFTLTYFIGIFFSYLINARYVFFTSYTFGAFFRFVRVYFLLWCLNGITLRILVTNLGFDVRLAPIFASIIIYPIGYMLLKGKVENSNE
jgi:putative flippase GtrA